MSFLEQFKDASIGFSGYPRLARRKSGAFGYMALLLAVVLAISAVIDTVNVRRESEVMVRKVAAGPDFGIRNGEVYFDGQMPYRYEENGLVIIVDTTGQTGPEALADAAPNSMLITRTKMYQKRGPAQIQTTDLSQLPLELNRQDVLGFLDKLWVIVPLGYLFIYLFQLGFKALDAAILGLVALAYGSATRRTIPYNLGFKLGLYAMTLPIVIQWLFPNFTTFSFQGFLIWWGLAILYLIMGLRAYYQDEDATLIGPAGE